MILNGCLSILFINTLKRGENLGNYVIYAKPFKNFKNICLSAAMEN